MASNLTVLQEIENAITLEQLDLIAARSPADETTQSIIRFRKAAMTAITQRDEAIAELKKRTLYSALTYGNDLKNVVYTGKPGTSHHQSAENVEKEITITEVDESLQIISTVEGGNVCFAEKLLGSPVKGSFEELPFVFNEADLQGIVHDVLQDSVNICNIILGLEKSALRVRREANLFTNRPDHSAVFLRNFAVPVVTVEDKPGKRAVEDRRVHGQKFDQLLESVLLTGCVSAIGAVTSIEETCIAWIGEEVNRIVTEGELLTHDKLANCRKRLEVGNVLPQKLSPSPKKQEEYPRSSSYGIQLDQSPSHARSAKKRRTDPKRTLFLSQIFDADQLVHVFCNLIIAGILVHELEPKVVTLPFSNVPKTFPACVSIQAAKTPPKISSLKTAIHGPAKRDSTWKQLLDRLRGNVPTYYLVARLAVGSTYNVFRALRLDGYECVVKMYIREYDEDGKKVTDFNAQGRKAVRHEEEMYKRVYPDLKDYVWTEYLSERPCLILPFFADLPKDQRSDSVSLVGELYQTHFVSRYCWMTGEDNVRWSHIGTLGQKTYLYSLSGLQPDADGGLEKDDLERILGERIRMEHAAE